MPATTEVRSEDHVSSRQIVVDGDPIDEQLNDRVDSIRVEQSLGLPDLCVMTVQYPPDEIDHEDFKIGAGVEVRFGETDAARMSTVFWGEVVTLAPVFSGGGLELEVWCYDRIHRLTRERKTRAFVKMTDVDIFEKMASEHGLRCDATVTVRPRHEHILQQNETDLEFINRRAERIGAEVVVENRKLIVRKRGAGEPVTVTYGETLNEFSVRITAAQAVGSVTVRAWDPKTKEAIVSSQKPRATTKAGITRDKVGNGFGMPPLSISTEPVATKTEADALATAAISKIADNYAMAEGWGKGNSRLKAGALLEVKGVGRRFGGVYRLTKVVHEQRGGGTFTTRCSSYPHRAVFSGGGQSASRPRFGDHVAIGIVMNTNDPDKLGRVKVKFPALDDKNESDWLRIATPSAGKERGLMMLPVVGEEVLVAFEHGVRPIIIGSLFNGTDKPGEILAAKDGSLGLKSDAKIVQAAVKNIELSTEESLQIKVKMDSKQDVGGNSTIDVKGNVEVKAINVTIKGSGQISIESTAPLTIKSSATVDISGSVVSVKSNGPLTLKGNPIMLN